MKKISLLLIFIIAASCGKNSDDKDNTGGTTTGNPTLVNMRFASYSSFSQNNMILALNSTSNLSTLTFCFKRLRFKSDTSSSNIDIELGEVTINQEGTDLSTVEVPKGTYTRIEFDLEKDCENNNADSVSLVNDNGTFSTDDRITIKFEGEIILNQSSKDLDLYINNFTDALKDYSASDGSIKDLLEIKEGSF